MEMAKNEKSNEQDILIYLNSPKNKKKNDQVKKDLEDAEKEQ